MSYWIWCANSKLTTTFCYIYTLWVQERVWISDIWLLIKVRTLWWRKQKSSRFFFMMTNESPTRFHKVTVLSYLWDWCTNLKVEQFCYIKNHVALSGCTKEYGYIRCITRQLLCYHKVRALWWSKQVRSCLLDYNIWKFKRIS